MMKNFILILQLLCCFLLGYSCAPVKNDPGFKKITVQFDGKRYDQLYLGTHLFGFFGDHSYTIIAGSSPDGYSWEFVMPDSIHQNARDYILIPKLYDAESKIVYAISLSPDADSQMEVPFSPNPDRPVRLIFQRSEVKRMSDYRIVQDSVAWVENVERDIFTFDLAENEEMAIACEMELGMIGSYNSGLSRGEQVYGILDTMIIKYPDSQFLVSQICGSRNNFSIQQIKTLYGRMSEANKASYAGKLLKNLIEFDPENFQFTNVELPAWDTHKPEWVITDTTKPTLIIFSASWCGHCHTIVPMLKEIYAEKGDDLNMVYISVDTEKFAEEWQKFMREKQIPWRSLILLNDPLGLQLKYNINGIPELFFVEPGSNFNAKIIDADTYDELKDRILRLLK